MTLMAEEKSSLRISLHLFAASRSEMRINMIFLYSAVLIIIMIPSLIFRRYKQEYRNSSSRRFNPLSLFYGLSFFITDLIIRSHTRLGRRNSSEPFASVRKKAAMLYPGENSTQHMYGILAVRMSLCMAVIIVFMIFGLVYSLNTLIHPTPSVTELKRPTDGSEKITYSLEIDSEGETEYIDVDVSKKIYEYGEVISIFDSHREEIIDLMLGDNASPERVTEALCFPSSLGEENIKLSWQPENLSYIDYNGSLVYENLSPDGTNTCVYVSMELDDVSASLMIGVTLYPKGSAVSVSLKSEVNRYILENNRPNSDTVLLPKSISGSPVKFSLPKAESSAIFLPIAIAAGIAAYISSSKDFNSRLRLRSCQLMQDYPEIVSKLLLLSNAGLNIQNAFRKIVDDYRQTIPKTSKSTRYAYEELSVTVNALENGGSESNAYADFGRRCGLMPYIRLGSLLELSLQKGTRELSMHLNNEVRNAFENHKSDAITRSKQAETKLIIPMIIILIVIMVLIIVPSFMNI